MIDAKVYINPRESGLSSITSNRSGFMCLMDTVTFQYKKHGTAGLPYSIVNIMVALDRWLNCCNCYR